MFENLMFIIYVYIHQKSVITLKMMKYLSFSHVIIYII